MKLRTSFFNPTVLKKDITRFAPVWSLYIIGMVLTVLLNPSRTDSFELALLVQGVFVGMSIVNLLYAGLCAAILFGDLYNSRLCNALHALPLRREGWFFTHTVAGMLFCIVPNTLIACLYALFLQQYAYLAFLWLAVTVLQFIFFFGVGAISSLCAGNRLGMIALYAILNFLSYIVALFIYTLYLPLLYGLEIHLEPFAKCCPVVQMTMQKYVNLESDYIHRFIQFTGLGQDIWRYTAVAAGVGVLLLGLSVVAYRKRQLETAGDLISVRWMRPVFLVILTLSAGMLLFEVADMTGARLTYFFLLVGLAIGFFIGKMLLERKVNIFKGKTFLSFAILLAVLTLSMGLVRTDPLNIVRRVPEVEQVEKVTLSRYSSFAEEYSDKYGRSWYQRGLVLTTEEDITTITQIHQALASDRYQGDDGNVLYLRYYLKNGTCIKRCYRVRPEGEVHQKLAPFFGRWELIFGTSDWEWILSSVDTASVGVYAGDLFLAMVTSQENLSKYDEEELVIVLTEENQYLLTDLLTAIRKDSEAGNITQDFAFRSDEESLGWITLQDEDGTYYCDICFYEDSTNTIQAIDAWKQAVAG